jgi:hypothetical protein
VEIYHIIATCFYFGLWNHNYLPHFPVALDAFNIGLKFELVVPVGVKGVGGVVAAGVHVGLVVVAVGAQYCVHEGQDAALLTVALVQIINTMYNWRKVVTHTMHLP